MKIARRDKEFVVTNGMTDFSTFGNFYDARDYLATNGNKDAQKKMYKMSAAKPNEQEENYMPTFLLNRRK